MMRRALWVAWPSFLMAGVLEMLVFSVADPAELHVFGESLASLPATGVYTLAFFCFWLVVALAASMTMLLATPEVERPDSRQDWP